MIVVVLLGAMLSAETLSLSYLWPALGLFLVVRPVATELTLAGTSTSGLERRMTSWFGIRGIGSIYYLCFSINHGLPKDYAAMFVRLVFTTIVASAVLHGTSVSPLMHFYSKRLESQTGRDEGTRSEPEEELDRSASEA